MEAGATSVRAAMEATWPEPKGLIDRLASVDHKEIGIRYMGTSAIFFVLAGLAALVMRAQLASAGADVVGPGIFDQLFTLHGVTMIFLFITPMLSGFGNYLVPLMVGARDMAFPRLNALSYWIFLAAGLFVYSSAVAGAAPDVGWFNYVPLSDAEYSPGSNIDFYTLGLIFLGISTTAGAINFIVTIFRLRAPGMSIDRIPLFCWAVLATSFAIVFAIPSLSVANLMLELQRNHGFHFFDVAAGGDPLLWQHLFWIFGHPDVYIIFLPAVGIVSTVIPVFSRRPMVAYWASATSMILIAFVGFGVWAHHMFVVGLPQIALAMFAAASLVIAIPSAIQVFSWIATIWTGRPVVRTPFLFTLGFVLVFVIGGISGVMFAVVPFDQQITDSYFVVAHFHYVLFGGAVFPVLAGLHYWLPKMTGRMPDERLGQWSFWLVFVGFNVTFFPMHLTGLLGMPRRVYSYAEGSGWESLNLLSTAGSAVLAVGLLAVLVNLLRASRSGPPSGDDPWRADTLEWSVSSPPPAYNFLQIPRVRSANPNWDEARPEPVGADEAAGHLTPATSVLDAEPERRLEMPAKSLLPILLAAALGAFFTGLLVRADWLALAGAVLAVGLVAVWLAPAARQEAAAAGKGRSSGWWGMALFVATEAMLCFVILTSCLYLRAQADGGWPPGDAAAPELIRPAVMSGLLLITCGGLGLAWNAVRRGQPERGRPLLWVGLLGALAFVVLQAVELSSLGDVLPPADGAYQSITFTITAVHLAHMVIGAAALAWAIAWLGRGRPGPSRDGLEPVLLYWGFLVALWLAVLFVVYGVPRW